MENDIEKRLKTVKATKKVLRLYLAGSNNSPKAWPAVEAGVATLKENEDYTSAKILATELLTRACQLERRLTAELNKV